MHSQVDIRVVQITTSPNLRFLRRWLAALVVASGGWGTDHAVFSKDASGVAESFPIASDGDVIVVPVQVGDETHSFLLDTGCFGLVYDIGLRHRLGLPKTRGITNTPGGAVAVEGFIPAADAQLGAIPLQGDPFVWTLDLRSLREFTGYDIKGLIGIEALLPYIVQMDFDGGCLRFLDRVPVDSGVPIPLTGPDDEGQLAVWMPLQSDENVPFVFDTGHGGNGTLSPPTFNRLRQEGRLSRLYRKRVVSVGRTCGVQSGSLDQINLGPNTHVGLDFSCVSGKNTLGLGVISRYVVTIDFPNRQLYLTAGKRFGAPQQRDLSGLAIARRDGHTVVTSVASGSPGETAGIQKDDKLLRVGELDARLERMFLLRRPLCQRGASVDLVLRRGSHTWTAQFELVDLHERQNP